MNQAIDLGKLVVDRSREEFSPRSARPKWLTRYVLPMGMLFAFGALLAWTARDSLLGGTPVTVVPVLFARGENVAAGESLFEAAGWIEPSPTPIVVSSLFEGVIERLVVVEGQEVAEGEPVAYLVDVFARLAVREAEAKLDLARAELARAEAVLGEARANFEEPLDQVAALADAEARLAKIEGELTRIPYQIRASEANHEFARLDLENKAGAQDSIARRALLAARNDLELAAITSQEWKAQEGLLARERDALRERRGALARQLEKKVAPKRALEEANASLAAANARVELAETALEQDRLRLDRMVVRAPVAGRVLALVAKPGSRLMGLERASLADASTVVTLYQPARLQVRADVRLEDVPRVAVGQKTRITTPAASGSLSGTVLAATSLADIQKNTLQVKVAIDAPPPVLKPDMLVRVTFLSPERSRDETEPPENESAKSTPLRALVPRALVTGSADSPTVWIADRQAGVARLRKIRLGPRSSGDWIAVTEGLAVGDKLIRGGRETLHDGERIRVVEEETEAGIEVEDSPAGQSGDGPDAP